MKRFFLCFSLLFLLCGCAKTPPLVEPPSVEPPIVEEDSTPTDPTEQPPTDPVDNSTEVEIIDPTTPLQSILITLDLMETKDLEDYLPPPPGQETISFSLSIPKDWTLDGTIFYDQKGNKLGELYPPVLIDSSVINADFIEKKIKADQESWGKILFSSGAEKLENGLTAFEMIASTEAGTGDDRGSLTWYPHQFRFLNGDSVLISLTFYSRDIKKTETSDFLKKIAKTIDIRPLAPPPVVIEQGAKEITATELTISKVKLGMDLDSALPLLSPYEDKYTTGGYQSYEKDGRIFQFENRGGKWILGKIDFWEGSGAQVVRGFTLGKTSLTSFVATVPQTRKFAKQKSMFLYGEAATKTYLEIQYDYEHVRTYDVIAKTSGGVLRLYFDEKEVLQRAEITEK